jgi:hypothetical protein
LAEFGIISIWKKKDVDAVEVSMNGASVAAAAPLNT